MDNRAHIRMRVTVTTNDRSLDPLQIMKRVYPEAVELAEILRHYLVDADGHWHGNKLWMAVDIAQGAFNRTPSNHLEDGDDD
ncbi:MAG: hypothetical protein WCF26_25145 [Candidatus Sulfotelmatobacter sp.]